MSIFVIGIDVAFSFITVMAGSKKNVLMLIIVVKFHLTHSVFLLHFRLMKQIMKKFQSNSLAWQCFVEWGGRKVKGSERS